MQLERFDLEKEYGIVLEGGGAKGSYQIGVWKALLEYGVKIKAVSGVSVGALNGALICMGDYERAVDIWKNISYSRIMNVDDAQMDNLMNRRFKEINLQEVRNQGHKFLVKGGFDVTPLKQLIGEYMDEKKMRESPIEFLMGTFNVSNLKQEEISAKEAEEGYLKDYLLASSSFPLFKNEKLHGKKYLDGGMMNNVPIDMLINRGYKDIIVIRIYGPGLEKRVKIPEDVKVINIAPRVHLCNTLEFNRKKAARNISIGYLDGLRMLKPLVGQDYYIDSARTEKEYMDSLLSPNEEQITKLLSLYKSEAVFEGTLYRRLVEEIYPQLANLLGLNKNWCYMDLYYAIIERYAKLYRLPKYKVYTEREFARLLLEMLEETTESEGETDVLKELVRTLASNILS